jgi:cob(I)alamin adenosyltransferase
MVKLDKIYTRGGDGGQSSLGGGERVAKHHRRLAVFGTVDEANAVIGIARLFVSGDADDMLGRIQNDLFDLGADLAHPAAEEGGEKLEIVEGQIERLEEEIDRLNEHLRPLESFILPGGGPASAHLNLARTVVRRAERESTALAEEATLNPLIVKYLNRLSDHLFVLARHLNNKGADDVLWKPGSNR